MSGEFNIFKNLDELRKTNLLAQIKNMESAKTNTHDYSNQEENDFDFDALLNNSVKSPTKRQGKKEPSCTPEKKVKKSEKSRDSSSPKERSISPVMALLENLSNKVEDNMPVGKRTRRSLVLAKQTPIAPPPTILDNEEVQQLVEASTTMVRGRGRGRGQGRGRGKGRNKGGTAQSDEESASENVQSSSNNVSEQGPDCFPLTLSIMDRFIQQGRRGRGRNSDVRTRRNYIAEIAARSTNVDYVDLISSPLPRVEGMITLDSDTEEPSATKPFTINSSKNGSTTETASLNISLDDDNPELSIKVTWKGNPEAFKLRKYQKFSTIFKELAERENTDIENVVLNLNNRIILPDDTPDSIDYKVFQFINGRVLANVFNSPMFMKAASKKRDANIIKLKIQSDKWKRPLQIDIMKSDKFRVLYIKCSEELKVGIEQLKLSFDGEQLDINDTPADLDLEGGEAIDLRIRN